MALTSSDTALSSSGEPPAPFEFATASRLVFGVGASRQLGVMARDLGRCALVVTGSRPERASFVMDAFAAAGLEAEIFPIRGEPTTTEVVEGAARARQDGRDVVVGIGGGSAIDAAKAIAGLLTNDGDLMEFIEVIGRGRPLSHPAAPWIAVPTTAGAGAEVTRNAVLTSREHRVKASLRSQHLLSRIAVVDPELTLELPPAVTAATGLDALTQLIEPFVSRRANPLVDALCRDGIRRVAKSLRGACSDGHDLTARSDMAYAALLGGLALANAGLGAVHGLAAPLGGSYVAPHGAVCAALLPAVMETNLRALRERVPESPASGRYDEVARLLLDDPSATAAEGCDWVRTLTADLRVPSLRVYGVEPSAFPALAAQAAAASSMKANPIVLTEGEVIGILRDAW